MLRRLVQSHQVFEGWVGASHEGAIWAEDVRIAFAVHVLSVALNTVAAVHLSQRWGHIGCRAEEISIGESARELHPLLIPVPPQDTLHLQVGEDTREMWSEWRKKTGTTAQGHWDQDQALF